MSFPTKDLKEKALLLRNSNPEGWDMFLASLDAYTNSLVNDVTDASSEFVLIAQGMARNSRFLLRTFKECDTKKKEAEPPVPQ